MFLFKFLSFCLGSATLGGTGAAIYCAINLKQNGVKDQDLGRNKLEEVEEASGQEAQTDEREKQSQTEQESPATPPQLGLVGHGSEPSSTY